MKRLVISVNPWPLWIAVDRSLAKGSARTSRVDGLNAFGLINKRQKYPGWRWSDRAADVFNRKYQRFVKPALQGKDITNELNICGEPPPLCLTVDELRKYADPRSGARLGLAALSSAISLTRVTLEAETSAYGETLIDSWRVAHFAHELALQVKELQYDEVYIFNGRHCFSRPFCDVLSGNTKVFMYDGGALPASYVISDGSLHDPDDMSALIRAQPVNVAAGKEFFGRRFERKPGNDASLFTSEQSIGKLPDCVARNNCRIVTFFTSSSDEYESICEKVHFGPCSTQGEVALELAKICSDLDKILVVRLHPNMKGAHKSKWNEWDLEALQALGACVLDPNDATDSYALMMNSAVVVTCGSTVGIEAAYAGRPSITVGRYISSAVGATVEGASLADLRAFIVAPWHSPQQVADAIAYGSFYMTSGRVPSEFLPGRHAEWDRINGKLVDPIRALYYMAMRPVRAMSRSMLK